MTDTLRIAIRKFDPFEAAIRRQFDSFRAETGCALRLETESLDLVPLHQTLFADGGLRDGAWDVAFVVTDWLAEAVEGGALLDLASRLVADPIPGDPDPWPPALTRAQRFGEAVYGVPYHDGPECLVYRRDLFADEGERAAFAARHGRPLTVPTTWDAFAEVARFFTRPAEGRFGALFAAYPDGHNSVYDFCLQLWSRGGELVDAAGAPTLDTPAAVAALDGYRALVTDRSLTPPGQEAIDSVASGERFAAGSIAMMVNWFGFAAACEQPGSPTKGKVDVAPPPAGADGRPASLNVYWLLAVGAGSRHPDAAYAFLRHVCSPAMDKVTMLAGGIGCRRSTWDDPEVNAAIPFAHRLSELHAHARELPRAAALPALVRVFDRAVQRALAGDEPSATILSDAQAEAAPIRLVDPAARGVG